VPGLLLQDQVQVAAACLAAYEVFDYADRQRDLRLADPQDDVINALTVAQSEGVLNEQEFHNYFGVLMIAGNETTRHTISHGMQALIEHRIAILHQKAQLDRLELTIPDDVILFIAEHVRISVRELEGSITKLLAYASLKHRQVSVELAREALRDKLQPPTDLGTEPARRITVALIQEMVSRNWGISVDAIQSKTRTKTITQPRQVAMYLIREILGIQLAEIGASFGGRDHSTVIHSIEKVAAQLLEDQEFKTRVFEMRRQLRSLQP